MISRIFTAIAKILLILSVITLIASILILLLDLTNIFEQGIIIGLVTGLISMLLAISGVGIFAIIYIIKEL